MEREKLIAIIDKAIDEHQTLCAEIIADAILEATQPILTDEDVKAWEDMKKEERKQKGAVWVRGEYDRLYEQLKANPERKIVCWVNYTWRMKNEQGETLRDICSIMGRVMGFNARGVGYGGSELWIGRDDERNVFIEECERLNVEWLDEEGEKGEVKV